LEESSDEKKKKKYNYISNKIEFLNPTLKIERAVDISECELTHQ
jgi:hypothetical protein